MNNLLGVMQGRLLPKYNGRYQAHPVNYWQEEFKIASNLGLDCIEFILDFNEANENPLLTKDGIDEINLISQEYGVHVKTICADYFMEAPLHSVDKNVSKESQKIMAILLENAKNLGVQDIVIPCVDQSSLESISSVNRFIKNLSPLLEIASEYQINLSLETDLNPKSFLKLINRFGCKNLTVNYDIGNSASLGYNCVEELDTYGHKISDIHIKDRLLNGGPVILGEGYANFDIFFNKLCEFDYQGPFIMQAYRDDQGIDVFKKQMGWVKEFFKFIK